MANDPNLKSLFENLNMISSDQVTQQRPGGGTGGGSIALEGNMDPNPLIGLNPYLSENVTSFSHGGGMSSAGSASSTGGGERWRYEQNRLPEPAVTTFAPAGINPEVRRLEEKARREQFMKDQGVPSSIGQSSYTKNYLAEQERRQRENMLERSRSGNMYGPSTLDELKHPWEQGYDNWYGQAKHGMRMPKYNKGGAMHQMPDGSMMAGATHPQAYNQGGSYLQQANQSIQASQQANEQQALGQLSGLVAKSLQQKMSPEQATSMASQMAEQSGLVNQPMANQPMANRGMRMRKRYTQGGRF